MSLISSALAGRFYTTSAIWEAQEGPLIDKKKFFFKLKEASEYSSFLKGKCKNLGLFFFLYLLLVVLHVGS